MGARRMAAGLIQEVTEVHAGGTASAEPTIASGAADAATMTMTPRGLMPSTLSAAVSRVRSQALSSSVLLTGDLQESQRFPARVELGPVPGLQLARPDRRLGVGAFGALQTVTSSRKLVSLLAVSPLVR